VAPASQEAEKATSVVEAVQTFVGIVNENEFSSHHYLSEW
jgi:hypothetical protein